jgi:hypothetical protein
VVKARDLISSSTTLGLGDHLARPADLPCPTEPAMVDLTVCMAERMSVALNLFDQRKPAQARHRLSRFWFDCSVYLRQSPAVGIVRERLKKIPLAEERAAFAWFAGSWHDDGASQARLLWRIQCSSYVVTGADMLHIVGSADDEGPDHHLRYVHEV